MKMFRLAPLAAIAVVLPVVSAAVLQYSEAKVVDVFGTIESVRELANGASLPGIHLAVKKDKHSVVDVYLGPTDFVTGFSLRFRAGDTVEAVGSKVKVEGADVILARQIRKNDSTVYLRDDHGNPLWIR